MNGHVERLCKAVQQLEVAEISCNLVRCPFAVKGDFSGQFVYLAHLSLIDQIGVDCAVLTRAHCELDIAFVTGYECRCRHFYPSPVRLLHAVVEYHDIGKAQSPVYRQVHRGCFQSLCNNLIGVAGLQLAVAVVKVDD